MSKYTVPELKSRGVGDRALNTNLTKQGYEKLADQIKNGAFTSSQIADSGQTIKRYRGAFFYKLKGSTADTDLIVNLFTKEMLIHGGYNMGQMDLVDAWEKLDVSDDGYGFYPHTVITDLQDDKPSPYVEFVGLTKMRHFERFWLKHMRRGGAVSFYSPFELQKNDWYSSTFLAAIADNNILVGL